MEKNVLITGANRGIGLELVRLYRRHGWKVWATCRQASAELSAAEATVITGVDLHQPTSLRALADQSPSSIQLLINNAGILHSDSLGNLDPQSLLEQFQVNAVGTLLVTELLASKLQDGGKIAILTSRMGSIADNSSGGYYGYRMSKAALNGAAKSLSLDLGQRNIAVGVYHPGFVRTGMTGGRGDVTAEQSAKNLAQRIDELDMSRTGCFYHADGSELSW